MNTTITVEVRNNYGREAIYVTSEHSQYIYRLTGKKTIDGNDIEALKALGFTVVGQAKAETTF